MGMLVETETSLKLAATRRVDTVSLEEVNGSRAAAWEVHSRPYTCNLATTLTK